MRFFKKKYYYFIICYFLTCYFTFGKEKNIFLKEKKQNFNTSNLILEHIKDSHNWEICSGKIRIPLPIILWDNNFIIFSSSLFKNKKKIAKKNGKYYIIFKEKIYKTNSYGRRILNTIGNPINKKPIDLSITKNVFITFISSIILYIIFLLMSFSYQNYKNRWKIGKILEPLLLLVRNIIAIPNIGINYKKYFSFLLTTFFFILFNNILGLFPSTPNITGNINTTLFLSIIVFIFFIFHANKSYWKHTFCLKQIPVLIRFLLFPIEFISMLIRPFTLCIRLFANITAGHILNLSIISLIFIFKNILIIGVSIPFLLFISLLEFLVSFLQAFIFTSLSALLIGASIKRE